MKRRAARPGPPLPRSAEQLWGRFMERGGFLDRTRDLFSG